MRTTLDSLVGSCLKKESRGRKEQKKEKGMGRERLSVEKQPTS